MSDLSQNETILQTTDQTCPATGYQPATVCVPVRVRPFARAGTTVTHCCGEPLITPDARMCTTGTVNGVCTFTITQDICVEIPVTFGARASVGAPSVLCGDATDEDICTNCDADDSVSDNSECPCCTDR